MAQKTYTCILRNAYKAPKKYIQAQGRRLEFIDGVAHGVPEYPARMLLHNKIAKEIILEQPLEEHQEEVFEEVVNVQAEEVVTFENEDAPEQEQPQYTEQEIRDMELEGLEEEAIIQEMFEEEQNQEEDEEEEISAEEAPQQEVKVVEGVIETEDGILTKEEVESMYERLGTWTAVANELQITTTTLRRYREVLGLL